MPPYSNGPNITDRAACLFRCIIGRTAVRAVDCILLYCCMVSVRVGKGNQTLGKKYIV
jgi:hypothetical protein